MKCFLYCIVGLSCLLLFHPDAFCSETYYLENNRVLLYKIINWWYDCLPEESTQLCGSLVKCQSKGDTQVEYNETEMVLKLQIRGGFGRLLSIFKQCEKCYGPSYLKCIWFNKKYFGSGEAVIVTTDLPTVGDFIFNNIDNIHSRRIKSIEEDIVFELEGKVGGLLNGRIALHHAGNFIRTCPKVSQRNDEFSSTTLKIINSYTEEVLAKYSTILNY